MTDQVLRAALLKLRGKGSVPASQFSAAQRSALDRFARQTGAVSCQRQGRGDVYGVCDLAVFEAHVVALSPQVEPELEDGLPLRAQHLAHARSSKARQHQHLTYYPLLKAVGDSVMWRQCGREGERDAQLALGAVTQAFGAATLCLRADDGWNTDQALWLVENQALFDRTDWLPEGTHATLLYYGGQLDGRLLSWLRQRRRASRIMLFPDYDGVGLANFARLYAALGDECECWLMPQWQHKLERYGSNALWRDTLRHFSAVVDRLPPDLRELTDHMQRSGLALEQEVVWLPAQ